MHLIVARLYTVIFELGRGHHSTVVLLYVALCMCVQISHLAPSLECQESSLSSHQLLGRPLSPSLSVVWWN